MPQLWNLVPLDPMSLPVLYNEHNAALADLISSNMPHRLPPESLRGGSSPPVSPSSPKTYIVCNKVVTA